MPYDDLLRSFIGVPASGNKAIEVTHADKLPEIFEEDANERVYDELSKSFVGIAAPSSENSQGFQASAYWVQRDEAEEMAYDELSKSFVGIGYPSTQTIEAFRDPS
jgi:hypothetical protein